MTNSEEKIEVPEEKAEKVAESMKTKHSGAVDHVQEKLEGKASKKFDENGMKC